MVSAKKMYHLHLSHHLGQYYTTANKPYANLSKPTFTWSINYRVLLNNYQSNVMPKSIYNI